MKFKLADYKGKHFVIVDELGELDFLAGEIDKEQALDKDFIKAHRASCDHYGIPCYVGNDDDMKEAYK